MDIKYGGMSKKWNIRVIITTLMRLSYKPYLAISEIFTRWLAKIIALVPEPEDEGIIENKNSRLY